MQRENIESENTGKQGCSNKGHVWTKYEKIKEKNNGIYGEKEVQGYCLCHRAHTVTLYMTRRRYMHTIYDTKENRAIISKNKRRQGLKQRKTGICITPMDKDIIYNDRERQGHYTCLEKGNWDNTGTYETKGKQKCHSGQQQTTKACKDVFYGNTHKIDYHALLRRKTRMKTWKYQKTQISKNNENKDNREEKNENIRRKTRILSMATMEIRNTVNGNKQKNKQTDLKDIDY